MAKQPKNFRVIKSINDLRVPRLIEKRIKGGIVAYKEFSPKRTNDIGRILVCHLLIEHYMTRCIEVIVPTFIEIEAAQLSFSKKVTLLGGPDSPFTKLKLVPGLRCLNKIRNDIAHNIGADLDVLFGNLDFIQPMMPFITGEPEGSQSKAKHSKSKDLDPNQTYNFFDSIALIERFADLACILFDAFIHGKLYSEKELAKKTRVKNGKQKQDNH